MTEEKKRKNLLTYAVVMLLSTVFVIIIAAMADHRENQFENQITEQAQINIGIQNRIVGLEKENHNLKKEAEESAESLAQQEQEATFYRTLSQVYGLALNGRPRDASAKLLEINPDTLTEEQKTAYITLQKQLQLPLK